MDQAPVENNIYFLIKSNMHLSRGMCFPSLLTSQSRVPHERKKENKKHEEPPEGLAQPHGQLLEKGEGVHIPEDRTEDTGGDQSTEEGPPLSKTEARKDARGTHLKLPTPLGPVYPLFISSPSSKAVGRSWQLSPPAAKNFQIHDVPVARPPPAGPFPGPPGHEDREETGRLEGASQSLRGHQHAQMLSARAGLHPFPGPRHHGDAKAGISPTPAHESAHAQNGHFVHR
ncbi:uncharacterized protein [Myotis yumanensis]|uniref:uncharacterized protein isoform X5 n=1 Tax=Myotis yumanensis TaxID=159337 RepID=UPI0038D40D04